MPTLARQLEPIPFTKVTFDDVFWSPRLEANRKVTIPHNHAMCESTGRFSAFDLNFTRAVPSPIVLIFGDSDAAKWVEAASLSLVTHPDPDLRLLLDKVTDQIIHAQQPDGYLNTHFTVAQPEMRWKNLRDCHEMYCAGHLIEAAVAHYQATGETRLLDALCRYADHIDALFGSAPGKKRGYPGHPELELALIKLYHTTNNSRYLELSSYFVDERGTQPHYYDIEARERGEDPAKFFFKNYDYSQAQVPVREQTKVVGHAVRAMYLLSAMADLAHEKSDPSLLETCERLWENLVTKRMYLTGGIGPSRHNEGFTDDYDLPDESAYAETCATIGLMLWNQRLLQFSGDSKYADVIERGMYNGFLSSISLSGDRFFYENPLASTGSHHRQAWFDCPCCPPNVARTLASLGGYFYSSGENSLWVHLFAQGSVALRLSGQDVNLRQVTNFPWGGAVKFEIGVSAALRFGLYLRMPGWCNQVSLSINGQVVAADRQANGYVLIEREWLPGDVVEYVMDMPVQVVFAHPAVRFLQGRMALQRGPLIYCMEGVDNGQIALDQISLDPARVLSAECSLEHRADLLGGVTVLHGKGSAVDVGQWQAGLYAGQPPVMREMEFTAIPYYAWDEREAGDMRVWFRAQS